MSDFKRLERIVRSYTGILRRKRKYYYSAEDARAILTELGLQMSARTFSYLTDETLMLEEFVAQLHESEEALGFGVVKEMREIHPALKPAVSEVNGYVVFTIQHNDREKIIAEIRLPWLPTEPKPEGQELGNTAPGSNFTPPENPFDIPIS